jgi:hypothetical protein
MTEDDFNKFLAVLDKLLQIKKPFAFIVDARDATLAPLKCGIVLIHWMSRRKSIIKKYLLASSLVTNYKKLITVVKWVFTKQRPTSPNLLTSDYDEGYEYVYQYLVGSNVSERSNVSESSKSNDVQLIDYDDSKSSDQLDEELKLIIVQKD